MNKPVMKNISISRQKKLLIFLVLVLCITGLLIYLNSSLLPIGRHWSKIDLPRALIYPKHNRKDKVILYWNTFFDRKDMYFGIENIFDKCSCSNCYATYNKSYLPVEQFDAIIFHAARYNIYYDMYPRLRNTHQKYIFYSLESPYNTNFDEASKIDFYNWTMTYRRDSDIHCPYDTIVSSNTNYKVPDDIKNKTKFIAWFVSNCQTEGSQRRMKYVMELQKYIQVDIYGSCGDLKCKNRTYCYGMLERDYKFYLSFENSMCQDYVTEKLFNILHLNVVPIVLGIFDYSNIAPPNSIINAYDFKNPKDLATYLYQLDKNFTAYSQYFEWKKYYRVKEAKEYTLCQICKKLNEPLIYTFYEDIEEWFYGYKCIL